MNAPFVSIPIEHYNLLITMAAEAAGRSAARATDDDDPFHPGDTIGTILCEAWRIEGWKASSAMVSYMVALRNECERLQVAPPAFTDVLLWLPRAINTVRFPDVDVEKMRRKLAEDVPAMVGQSI